MTAKWTQRMTRFSRPGALIPSMPTPATWNSFLRYEMQYTIRTPFSCQRRRFDPV